MDQVPAVMLKVDAFRHDGARNQDLGKEGWLVDLARCGPRQTTSLLVRNTFQSATTCPASLPPVKAPS